MAKKPRINPYAIIISYRYSAKLTRRLIKELSIPAMFALAGEIIQEDLKVLGDY